MSAPTVSAPDQELLLVSYQALSESFRRMC